MPPQPTASASAAAIRPRHGKAAAMSDLREASLSEAIGDVLNPGLLTVGSIANNPGFRTCGRADPIAARSERPYPADAAFSRQDTKNGAETRCRPHAPFPPTESKDSLIAGLI